MGSISQQATNERSLRSVFVGNIPYDASEERLKDIFSEAGPVLSFKLVYDRESGKPKGYGFCEYRDQETALSAMRNLNSYELNGRNLRVDTATNERFKEEIKNLQMSLSGSTFESPYGPEIDPDKAPEQIAKVVSSLPPEQMFEIAKQMKHCVLTNPNEARNMLLQNPQLAYALLQLLVVMRAIDIQTASSILYKPNPPPVPIASANLAPVPGIPQQPHPGHMVIPPQQQTQPPPIMPQPPMHQNIFDPHADQYNRGGPPPQQNQFDPRLDPRLRQNEVRAQEIYDPRLAQQQQSSQAVAAPPPMDPRLRGQAIVDPRQISQQPPTSTNRGPAPGQVPTTVGTNVPLPMDPRMPNQQPPMFNQPNFGPGQQQPIPGQAGSTAQLGPIPVSAAAVSGTGQLPPPPPPQQQQQQQQGQGSNQMNQSEQEKAQLIMQVLSLSDQQINMLPADQRQSILLLRQQLQQQNK